MVRKRIFSQMELRNKQIAILLSNKIDFILKSIRKDGKEHFILIPEKSIKMKSQS